MRSILKMLLIPSQPKIMDINFMGYSILVTTTLMMMLLASGNLFYFFYSFTSPSLAMWWIFFSVWFGLVLIHPLLCIFLVFIFYLVPFSLHSMVRRECFTYIWFWWWNIKTTYAQFFVFFFVCSCLVFIFIRSLLHSVNVERKSEQNQQP